MAKSIRRFPPPASRWRRRKHGSWRALDAVDGLRSRSPVEDINGEVDQTLPTAGLEVAAVEAGFQTSEPTRIRLRGGSR